MALVPSTNCDHCDSEKIENAEYFCHTCKHGLCKACKNKHDKIPDTRGHNVTLYERIDRSVFSTSLNCDSHNEGLSIFCDSCKCLICNRCVTTTHKTHQFSDVSSVVAEMKEDVKFNLKRVETQIKDISKISLHANMYMKQLGEDVHKFTSTIKSISATVSHILGSQVNIGITEYEDFEHLKKEEVQYALKSLDCAFSEYISVQSELGNVLTEKHDVKFILDNQIILTHVSNLEKLSKADFEFVDVRYFNPELFIEDVVDKICAQYNLRRSHEETAEQYKKERDMARSENRKLKDDLEKQKSQRTDANKIIILNEEKEKLKKHCEDLTAEIDTLISKEHIRLASSKENMKLMDLEITSLRNIIDNLTIMNGEVQKRADEHAKDANVAIYHYQEGSRRIKKELDQTKEKFYKLKMENEEYKSMLQKRRMHDYTKQLDNLHANVKELKLEKDKKVLEIQNTFSKLDEREEQKDVK